MSDTGQYLPSQEALEFIAFIRAAGIEENDNAEIYYRLADMYFSRDKQILIESSRDSAKSTIREWAKVYKLRTDSHAQKEVQDLLHMIDEQLSNKFGLSWRN